MNSNDAAAEAADLYIQLAETLAQLDSANARLQQAEDERDSAVDYALDLQDRMLAPGLRMDQIWHWRRNRPADSARKGEMMTDVARQDQPTQEATG